MTNPFADADVISSYSRAQAIEDGVLVDVTTMDKTLPCGFCGWCLFNLKWHGRAYLSLCTRSA
jgi:hypothetical protein